MMSHDRYGKVTSHKMNTGQYYIRVLTSNYVNYVLALIPSNLSVAGNSGIVVSAVAGNSPAISSSAREPCVGNI